MSLPLPLPDKKVYKCAVFPAKNAPRQYEFRLKVSGKLLDMKAAVAKRLDISVSALQARCFVAPIRG